MNQVTSLRCPSYNFLLKIHCTLKCQKYEYYDEFMLLTISLSRNYVDLIWGNIVCAIAVSGSDSQCEPVRRNKFVIL